LSNRRWNNPQKLRIIVKSMVLGFFNCVYSGRNFELIRVHDGVATAIAGTYDEKTHVFTFETDKFSTYALAYKDSAVAGGTTNSTQPTSPKTGDTNGCARNGMAICNISG
jgi:hypothetical protein